MRKIGIMGGTFDPVHNGHLMLADTAYRQFDLDQVWFLPNGNPPHKKEENIGQTPGTAAGWCPRHSGQRLLPSGRV